MKEDENMIIPNIDWITVSFDFSEYNESSKDIVDLLNAAKEKAKEKQNGKTSEKEQINIDGMTFEVFPNGNRMRAFIINNEDYNISIAEFRSRKETIYPISAIIHSKALWSYSPIVAYARLYCMINNVFGEVVKNMVSRIDLCCHNDIIDFSTVNILDFRNRANKKNTYTNHNIINGFNFGTSSGGLMCRVYNKTLEVIEKNDKTWFFDIWDNNGVKGTVWNVEFQLKREYFRNYDIDTVEQAFAHIGTIWDYCTKDWLVLTDNDRTRLENCTTNNEWLLISESFKDYCQEPMIKRDKQNYMDGDALVPAWAGYTTSIAALFGVEDIESVIEIIKEKGKKYLWLNKQKTYFDEIIEKKNLLQEK